MTAVELRLGNWVYSPSHKANYKVIKLEFDAEVNAEPIQLTEEWLLKFGFKKYPNLRDTFRQEYYDSFQLDIDEHTIISFSIPIGYNDNIRCNYDKLYRSEEKKQSYRVKHIHQLQNLYFALTGEELTFKSE